MDRCIYCLEILAEESEYSKILGILALEAAFGWEEQSLATGETRFSIHCENPDILENIRSTVENKCASPSCVLKSVEHTDWLEAWKEFFTPVFCGSRFVILPPWLKSNTYSDREKIIIEPKCAFGTGHHATTALCVAAISDLAESALLCPGKTFLDLGCGSGILGIAACKTGMSGLAVDTDALAIENTLENREINGANSLEVALGSIEKATGKRFDFVVANILAGPLMELAPQILGCLNTGASLLLSGILDIQAPAVMQAYMDLGLPAPRVIAQDEWRALLWERNCNIPQ